MFLRGHVRTVRRRKRRRQRQTVRADQLACAAKWQAGKPFFNLSDWYLHCSATL
jgi:hypothetical protein